jgi:hypothetical protein
MPTWYNFGMSQDVYQLDRSRHGGVHVDRYSRQGTLVGRYRPDRSPIKHNGRLPPVVPGSDFGKFDAALARERPR